MTIPILEVQPERQKTSEHTYLKLQIDEQTPAVISMAHVQEVLVVPVGRIALMPNMPACVLGLLNQRSRVLWAIALPQMLSLHNLDTQAQSYSIVIIRVGKIPLGLAVQAVKGVVRFPSNSLQSPIGTVTAELIPYIRGCILQPTEVVLVLDAEAIVHSPMFKRE